MIYCIEIRESCSPERDCAETDPKFFWLVMCLEILRIGFLQQFLNLSLKKGNFKIIYFIWIKVCMSFGNNRLKKLSNPK